MPKANLNDRSSIEAIYPAPAWERDAARNARGEAAVTHGVKILSAPDADGTFELATASQHVGESTPDTDSIFIPAHEAEASEAGDGPAYGNSLVRTNSSGETGEYARFIDGILEAARTAHFKPPIGKGEERLKGFRGG